jgi:hypothetical protein
MRILAIGLPLHHPNVTNDDFSSPRSMLDFDAVVWNPAAFPFEYEAEHTVPTYRGARCLSEDGSALVARDLKRRGRELRQFVQAGRLLAICVPPPAIFYRATGQVEYSGSHKNRRTRRIVEPIAVLSALPLPGLETIEGAGSAIDFRGEAPFKDYWTRAGKYHRYAASLSKPVGKPFAFVHGTDEAVATAVATERGTVLLLPGLQPADEFERIGDYRRATAAFVDALVMLYGELARGSGDFALPTWAKAVLLPGELALLSEATRKEHALKAACDAVSEVKQRHLALAGWKMLLAGSGVALDKAVRAALDELGFTCAPAAPQRSEIFARFADAAIVVEVKAMPRGAAERHAAELERCASEHFAQHDVRPKAILLVNAYCDTPLPERKDPFPSAMRRYAERREHCLCTTTQLLGLYFAARQAPDQRELLVRDLLETVGVYERFADPQQFLTLPSPPTADQALSS